MLLRSRGASNSLKVENKPNIYGADKSIKFARDVCFGILIRTFFARDVFFGMLIRKIFARDVFFGMLIRKNCAPSENSPLTHFGAIKMVRNISNIFNFSLNGPI